MRRIISVLAVMALMAAMMVASAMPAFADPPLVTGKGAQGKGALVIHCKPLGELLGDQDPLKGNVVFNSGNEQVTGSGCRFA
jgi:hypothetical protein